MVAVRCFEYIRTARTSSVIGCVVSVTAEASGDAVVVLFTVHWNRLLRKPCLELSAMESMKSARRKKKAFRTKVSSTRRRMWWSSSEPIPIRSKPPSINRYRQLTLEPGFVIFGRGRLLATHFGVLLAGFRSKYLDTSAMKVVFFHFFVLSKTRACTTETSTRSMIESTWEREKEAERALAVEWRTKRRNENDKLRSCEQ